MRPAPDIDLGLDLSFVRSKVIDAKIEIDAVIVRQIRTFKSFV
jgi:hypothetical protein